jgi:hypothetical protein
MVFFSFLRKMVDGVDCSEAAALLPLLCLKGVHRPASPLPCVLQLPFRLGQLICCPLYAFQLISVNVFD